MPDLIDWESNDWPKKCVCGYVAENERDAVGHAVSEHTEWVTETDN